jgi:hypothetical protein
MLTQRGYQVSALAGHLPTMTCASSDASLLLVCGPIAFRLAASTHLTNVGHATERDFGSSTLQPHSPIVQLHALWVVFLIYLGNLRKGAKRCVLRLRQTGYASDNDKGGKNCV